MHLATGYEDRRPRIEIVPLIDVVFLLLVFFIYAMLSMTVYRGLRVDLPSGEGTLEQGKTIMVMIDENNAIFVGGERMTLVQAVGRVAAKARDKDKPVLVSGDSRSNLGTGIELLSALRSAGVKSVSFQVSRQE
ncbi:MAG: biopolymer transporter ExbD [Kiritimatiellia bacterium]